MAPTTDFSKFLTLIWNRWGIDKETGELVFWLEKEGSAPTSEVGTKERENRK